MVTLSGLYSDVPSIGEVYSWFEQNDNVLLGKLPANLQIAAYRRLDELTPYDSSPDSVRIPLPEGIEFDKTGGVVLPKTWKPDINPVLIPLPPAILQALRPRPE
jgi:hypothetical protein